MFKIDFLVEDKHLPKVLHALASFHVLNLNTVPVVNAKVANGKVQQETSSVTRVDRIRDEISKTPGVVTSTTEIRALIAKDGGSEASAGYIINGLIDSGHLKRLKERGSFKIIG